MTATFEKDLVDIPSLLPKDQAPLSQQITEKEFLQLRNLVYERFGINLTDSKKTLVVGRLRSLLRASGYQNFQQYLDVLYKDSTNRALDELINRISTNYSFFFREKNHFDFFAQTALTQIMEQEKKRNGRDLRIWSAGCSTGEEPYTLAILLFETLGAEYGTWDAGILATDVSDRVLKFASQGVYPKDRLSKMPPTFVRKYFTSVDGGMYRISDRVKQEVTFRRFNLMNAQFPFKKPFHMIFCRNVMIYFDKETRENLIRKYHSFLEPGGYLFIGHSETMGRDHTMFQYVIPACYRKI